MRKYSKTIIRYPPKPYNGKQGCPPPLFNLQEAQGAGGLVGPLSFSRLSPFSAFSPIPELMVFLSESRLNRQKPSLPAQNVVKFHLLESLHE